MARAKAQGMRIEVIPFGDTQVSRTIMRVGLRGKNLRLLWPVLAKYFYSMEEKQFASEGAFGGNKWPALKDATVARKGSDEILKDTDTLYESLTRSNAKFSKRTDRAGEFFRGSSDPIGVHHQFGAPRANVPMRKPVQFRDRDKVAWVKMVQRFVITGQLPGVPSI